MSLPDLTAPSAVMARLDEIDREASELQNDYELAAMRHFKMKRQKEHQFAVHFMRAEGTVAERTARAKELTELIGMEEEAAFEAAKARMRVLETRASIGQSILKAQGRA